MPVSLLTPIAGDLHLTEGQAGQAISISGLFAVITSLFIAGLTREDRPQGGDFGLFGTPHPVRYDRGVRAHLSGADGRPGFARHRDRWILVNVHRCHYAIAAGKGRAAWPRHAERRQCGSGYGFGAAGQLCWATISAGVAPSSLSCHWPSSPWSGSGRACRRFPRSAVSARGTCSGCWGAGKSCWA